ncbi:MAG TPA: DedA family protein [Ktedonobacteraceae bacterium]|nr:DedA family protein [Ktedonobacteraceae bacterium]
MYWLLVLHIKVFLWLREPLAALISLATLQNALDNFGYAAVALFIMIESSGIPFPGETMLLLASFYAAVSHQLQIPLVIACAAFGAIIGDNIGYLIGRTGGRSIVVRYGRYVFIKPEHLALAEAFFAKHGNKTVFFGRFITLLRAWAAFLAGVNHMHWRTFLFYNAAGGILWATIYGTLGYIAGRFFHDNFAQVERLATTLGWLGTGLIVVAVLTVLFVIRMRRHKHTQTIVLTKENRENEKEEIITGL